MIPRARGAGQYFRTSKNIPLYVTGVKSPVAFVHVAKHLLFKTVDGTRHFVVIPPSIAFDDGVLERAGALGVQEIEVTDGATGDIYTTTLKTFLDYAEVVNRGHGRQLALRFDFWSKNGAPSEVEQRAAAEAAKVEAAGMAQLGLFAGVTR